MAHDYQDWLWEKQTEQCVNALKKHGFDAHRVGTTADAKTLILGMVSEYQTFGFGGSDTTRQIGVLEELKAMGKTVYVKKPECPVLCTGMNGQCSFGGMRPQIESAYSGLPAGRHVRSPALWAGFFTPILQTKGVSLLQPIKNDPWPNRYPFHRRSTE